MLLGYIFTQSVVESQIEMDSSLTVRHDFHSHPEGVGQVTESLLPAPLCRVPPGNTVSWAG